MENVATVGSSNKCKNKTKQQTRQLETLTFASIKCVNRHVKLEHFLLSQQIQ